MVKAKRSQKVRYWVNYRLPNGKQRREAAGFFIEEARAAEGKRKAQKVESPGILERVPAEKMTFTELIDWYLNLNPVKKLVSYERVKGALANFNNVLGDRIVSSLKPLTSRTTRTSGKMLAGRPPPLTWKYPWSRPW